MKTDISYLKSWVGKFEERFNKISPEPMAGLAATLDRSDDLDPKIGDPVPPAGHWLYFLPVHPMSDLGSDGHGKRGGFLPPVDLPHRMWAGGRIEFLGQLRIGDTARRVSTIKSVSHKRGKSGDLVFVVVEHQIFSQGCLAISEEHDIVYRDSSSPQQNSLPDKPAPTGALWTRTVKPDPILLFRYSALTFNSHRIHYDLAYATKKEGYSGLIVHGPLIATLLMDLCCRESSKMSLTGFNYRAVSPIFDTGPFSVNGSPSEDGTQATMWATTNTGGLAMRAEAEFGR